MASEEKDSGVFTGFMIGVVGTLIMSIFVHGVVDSVKNRHSEIVRVEYRNRNGEASREIVENMVKSQFPSNKWQNADYDCNKFRVKIELSNP
jgi:hypothetical protein